MTNYDLSALHDKEFEELARDILNKQNNLDLQNFKQGKDKGIDLRYATNNNNNEIIVQAKHYLKTGFVGLLKTLKEVEKKNVLNLKPNKYYIVTSCALSPQNKNEIYDVFKPYMPNTNYILGQEDINKYLAKNHDIVEKHYKLWLTSSKIIGTIVNKAVYSKAKFFELKILKDISLFVKTKNYEHAADKLKENKFLLISGQPGVGKTTLAKGLAYEYMARGYQLYYIEQDITEAEKLISEDKKEKQIFLLDDFLGSNYIEIVNHRAGHSSIVVFIERIMASHNKYCILTTRTNILNKSYLLSENLKRSSLKVSKLEIEVKEYNQLEKAKILYNHFYYHNLKPSFLQFISNQKKYWDIIKHSNYYPRLVEFFTKERNLSGIKTGEEYFSFIKRTLDNPEEVWFHAFNEQIEEGDRYLIISLFSLNLKQVNNDDLQIVFENKLEFEIRNNNYKKPHNSYNTSLNRLQDSFFQTEMDKGRVFIKFLNPSINDFLINYFKDSKEARVNLIRCSIYYLQFEKIISLYKHFKSNKIFVSTLEYNEILNAIIDLKEKMVFNGFIEDYGFPHNKISQSITNKSIQKIKQIFLLLEIINLNSNLFKEIDTEVYNLLSNIEFDIIAKDNYQTVLKLVEQEIPKGKSYDLLERLVPEITKIIVNNFDNLDEIDRLKTAHEKYNFQFDSFLNFEKNNSLYYGNLETSLTDHFYNYADELKTSIFNLEDYENAVFDLKKEINNNLEKYNIHQDIDINQFLPEDELENWISENHLNASSDKYDNWRGNEGDFEFSNLEIDNLFSN